MAPLTPHWSQPSHPSIQQVIIPTDPSEFTTKSVSKVTLAPYAVFAKLSFPPVTKAPKPTYATLQIFDTTSLSILAGPNGLKAGEELTFFYPSTEWNMAQGFSCFCGAAACRGYISGAKNMKPEQLEGVWLNAHIRSLLEERDAQVSMVQNGVAASAAVGGVSGNGTQNNSGDVTKIAKGIKETKLGDATEEALKTALEQARKMVDAAQKALDTYKSLHGRPSVDDLAGTGGKGATRQNGVGSRELSGEMGGDTKVEV